ncbi:hypothetical protein SAY86_013967 [Trapa natans]|uniref:TF-B3 domain-containing protein n=1 Tax=Trapa natans TaxID=22666 RepID=A0AAN7L069_TRANT|nr:hypothetical protein SAY86_013967 [Trapa natans]
MESSHFFKIILYDTIQSGKLMIPKKFLRKYGTELRKSDTAILKVPTHDSWKMELMKSHDSVWLDKGWPDFLNFYSIKHGHFLVFRPEFGTSSNEFYVVIFDKSCTEIEYPLKSHLSSREVKVENNETPVETAAYQPSKRKMKSKTHLQNGSSSAACFVERVGRTSYEGSLLRAKRNEAVQRAKSFKSLEPYFMTVMQPCYIRPPYTMSVPGRFMKKYIGKESGEVQLHVSDGKSWTVTYLIGKGRRRVEAQFGCWKPFVVDNDLDLGDICIFELIRTPRSPSFKVTILRAHKAGRSNGMLGHNSFKLKDETAPSGLEASMAKSKVGRAIKKQKIDRGFEVEPSWCVSEHPFFQATVSKSSISHERMNVPAWFTREHLNPKKPIVILKIDDQIWVTKLSMSSVGSRAYFGKGFNGFLKENWLDVGDVCTFELIQRDEMVFRVSICRGKEMQEEAACHSLEAHETILS